jgi:hypothetical protein
VALLVGYGTLLYRPSLGDTIGGTAASAIEMVPVVVAGYRRLFNLRPDHYVPLTSAVLGDTGIERDPAALLPLWRDVQWARAGAYQISPRFGTYCDRTTYLGDGATLVTARYQGHLAVPRGDPERTGRA